MFHEASLKLTGWYLALLMALSICFSIAFYRVSTNELDRGLDRQETALRNTPFFRQIPFNDDFLTLRQVQVEESKNRITLGLFMFNLGVLGLGGILSYILARRTLQPIEEALAAQSRFTGDASHELRTPLATLRAEIEVALRDKKMTLTEAKGLLKSNLEEVARLETLSSSLLKLAGRDTKLNPEHLTMCSLPEVVERAQQQLKTAAKARHITVTLNTKTARVKGDATALEELATILLDNAIKYSPEKTEVILSTYADTHSAYVVVRDQGMGIAPHDLPHIFDRFYRADQARSHSATGGYGLGLAIAQSIAQLHRGSISVVSTPGKGSVFTVRLPLA
jgi:signal transduction histidine kinase